MIQKLEKVSLSHQVCIWIVLMVVSGTLAFVCGMMTSAFAEDKVLLPTDPWELLVHLETQATDRKPKTSERVDVWHYEVPLSLVKTSAMFGMNPKIYNSLVYVRDGVKYLRWIIQPQDTRWHKKVKKFLDERGLDSEPKTYFSGYFTASRSIILEAPDGYRVGVKVSTNHAGGPWSRFFKKQTWKDALKIREVNDFIVKHMSRLGIRHFSLLLEPLAFGIEDLDQAMIFRDYDFENRGKTSLIPGTAVLNTEYGRLIARINGSDNPTEYWNEHFNKPLGKAFAEFYAYFGFLFSSPHSQQFLVEMDKDFKPTGNIVFRDVGDIFILVTILKTLERSDIISHFGSAKHRSDLRLRVSLLLGSKKRPDWMSSEGHSNFGLDFFKSFESEFSQITGVPAERLSSGGLRVGVLNAGEVGLLALPIATRIPDLIHQAGPWFQKNYLNLGPEWEAFQKRTAEFLLGKTDQNPLEYSPRCDVLVDQEATGWSNKEAAGL